MMCSGKNSSGRGDQLHLHLVREERESESEKAGELSETKGHLWARKRRVDYTGYVWKRAVYVSDDGKRERERERKRVKVERFMAGEELRAQRRSEGEISTAQVRSLWSVFAFIFDYGP